ncbi:sensor histidine kinase [Litoribacter populi]|uniref:sensor histidine kinase n=1 Tax=Litoribacter populi TaxID=2598460 RepID=UPI00117DDA3C|nr:histidine kinase [Litoribacter populi]
MKIMMAFGSIFFCFACLFIYLLYSEGDRMASEQLSSSQIWILVVNLLAVSLLVMVIYHFIIDQFKWRKFLGIRAVLNLGVLWGASIIGVYMLAFQLLQWVATPEVFPDFEMEAFMLKGAIVGLIFSVLITWGDFSWYNYNRYASEAFTVLHNNRKQKELQFQTLRSQLTPHFLFNSLNTASNLTHVAPEKSEEFLRKLAENFTYLLENTSAPTNSLERELEVVDNYFHLMKVRFQQAVILEKNIDPEFLTKHLPALSLQLLVENAFKHNVATEDSPVTISIKAEKKYIVVENNLTFRPSKVDSKGIGLKNLQARYNHFSNKPIIISRPNNHYQVRLPYIKELKKKNDVS